MGSSVSDIIDSAIGHISSGSVPFTVGSQSRSPSSVRAVAWARFMSPMCGMRAFAERRVPWQSGQVSDFRNFATRASPLSSFTFESAFFTVFSAL